MSETKLNKLKKLRSKSPHELRVRGPFEFVTLIISANASRNERESERFIEQWLAQETDANPVREAEWA